MEGEVGAQRHQRKRLAVGQLHYFSATIHEEKNPNTNISQNTLSYYKVVVSQSNSCDNLGMHKTGK